MLLTEGFRSKVFSILDNYLCPLIFLLHLIFYKSWVLLLEVFSSKAFSILDNYLGYRMHTDFPSAFDFLQKLNVVAKSV